MKATLYTITFALTLMAAAAEDLVPLVLNLPTAAFTGTPKDFPLTTYMEPLPKKPRPNLMVPAGLQNLALKGKLTSSDTNAQAEALAKIIDGDKEPREESIREDRL